MSTQCWAYSKQRQRCGKDAYHEGEPHGFIIEWLDDECYDPEVDAPIPFVAPRGGLPPAEQASLDEATLLDDLGTIPNGACFTCGCSEDAHPCDEHGCRSFVP